jgi:hypothetical protein
MRSESDQAVNRYFTLRNDYCVKVWTSKLRGLWPHYRLACPSSPFLRLGSSNIKPVFGVYGAVMVLVSGSFSNVRTPARHISYCSAHVWCGLDMMKSTVPVDTCEAQGLMQSGRVREQDDRIRERR